MTVDLENQLIHDSEGKEISFEVDPHWKEMLINGYDEISLTLLLEDDIQQFESKKFMASSLKKPPGICPAAFCTVRTILSCVS